MEPQQIAERAGLRHCTDEETGIRRRRCGRGFTYLDADGRTIDDPEVRERIRRLAIPPAWTDVWINPRPDGHLQCTGRDDRGRKQYLYHPEWNAARDRAKFERLAAFGEALPAIRRQVEQHLRLPEMPRQKVLATIVRLLETTSLRIGNAEYQASNGTFGLTTLRRRHVDITTSEIRFHFIGKGGREIDVTVNDERLAELVRQCDEVRGWEVFRYVDEDGKPRTVDSGDVNDYIRDAMGAPFTAKDFRTWGASARALELLLESTGGDDDGDLDARILEVIDQVAELLHNTRAVCRDSYVHPLLLETYREGELAEIVAGLGDDGDSTLSRTERVLLAVLRR